MTPRELVVELVVLWQKFLELEVLIKQFTSAGTFRSFFVAISELDEKRFFFGTVDKNIKNLTCTANI